MFKLAHTRTRLAVIVSNFLFLYWNLFDLIQFYISMFIS